MQPTVIKQYTIRYRGSPARQVGCLYSDGVFRKNVNCVEHQLIKPPAWCIDAKVFDDLEKRATSIVLIDRVNTTMWIISPKHFRANCGQLERMHRKQYFCPLKWWTCKPLMVPHSTGKEKPPPARQLTLTLDMRLE